MKNLITYLKTVNYQNNQLFLQSSILCIALSNFLFLSFFRADVLGINWYSKRSFVTFIPRAFISAYYDFLFLLVLTIITLVLLFVFRQRKYIQNLIYYSYLFISIVTLVIAFFNKSIIQIIGAPFNYQWLYYSDFLGGTDAQNALKANTNAYLFLKLFLVLLSMFLLSKLFVFVFRLIPWNQTNRKLSLLLFILIPIYHFTFSYYNNIKKWKESDLANPIVFFVKSYFNASTEPTLFTMAIEKNLDDNFHGNTQQTQHYSLGKNKIKNVVFFVLESVPTAYLEAYGGKFPVSPQFTKLLNSSILFTNIYAHSPSTNNSMVSILSSLYPIISYKTLTKQYPTINIPTISSQLKENNYRTAFFNAGDIRYQGAEDFLTHQKFDLIADFRSKFCKEQQFIVKEERWDNPDGADDACIVDAFDEWVGQDTLQPFFATLWTVQTHYPYFVSGKETEYKTQDPYFKRYLNALHHSDQALGRLIEALKLRKLDKNTLIVVVGDHGEAFMQHNKYGHGSGIYEENVHVPLMFINDSLFNGEKNNVLGGHIDIAPTIMDILNIPIPKQWQGNSLFNHSTKKRVYFFAPWSDYLFGYRDDNHKVIYNATLNTTEVYDLTKDSSESVNLSKQMPPEFIKNSHQHLASWVQYQDKYMKQVIADSK